MKGNSISLAIGLLSPALHYPSHTTYSYVCDWLRDVCALHSVGLDEVWYLVWLTLGHLAFSTMLSAQNVSSSYLQHCRYFKVHVIPSVAYIIITVTWSSTVTVARYMCRVHTPGILCCSLDLQESSSRYIRLCADVGHTIMYGGISIIILKSLHRYMHTPVASWSLYLLEWLTCLYVEVVICVVV